VNDFRVVQARALLKVHSVAPVRGFAVPAVVLVGEKLNQAQEILYNGMEVPEFIISSPSRLLARIPDSQVGKSLVSLQVLTESSFSNDGTLLSMILGKGLKKTSGIDRLVQNFVMTLLSSQGSDLFNQGSGGGAMAIVGKSNTATDPVSAQLALAVDRTRQQILRAQASNSRIPSSERLLSASLSSVTFNKDTNSLVGMVDIRSVAVDAALVTVR